MTDFWADFPGLSEELDRVSATMAEAVGSENPVIADATSALVGGDGKLLRPGLLIVASRFGRMDGKKRASLAAALEMLHIATLIHDDVIDDSPLRRGLPAAHVRYGKKDAVLIGDYLLSRCFLLAASYTSPENATRLARAISVICTMEIEQDIDRFKADPSVRDTSARSWGRRPCSSRSPATWAPSKQRPRRQPANGSGEPGTTSAWPSRSSTNP
jgi:heptaprenyl diphosphate synthase